jgi:hypothetical protein
MKCLVTWPIKFYKILRPVTTDARLWSHTDVCCICGRQFTFLSFLFLCFPFLSLFSLLCIFCFYYCFPVPLIFVLLVLHLFYLLCFSFLSFPVSVFRLYLLYFFRINISSHSTSFPLFFLHCAQNLLLFRYQCI